MVYYLRISDRLDMQCTSPYDFLNNKGHRYSKGTNPYIQSDFHAFFPLISSEKKILSDIYIYKKCICLKCSDILLFLFLAFSRYERAKRPILYSSSVYDKILIYHCYFLPISKCIMRNSRWCCEWLWSRNNGKTDLRKQCMIINRHVIKVHVYLSK